MNDKTSTSNIQIEKLQAQIESISAALNKVYIKEKEIEKDFKKSLSGLKRSIISEQLRKLNDHFLVFGTDYSDILLDAASEIERLRSEIDVWKDVTIAKDRNEETMRAEIKTLREEIERLTPLAQDAGELMTESMLLRTEFDIMRRALKCIVSLYEYEDPPYAYNIAIDALKNCRKA